MPRPKLYLLVCLLLLALEVGIMVGLAPAKCPLCRGLTTAEERSDSPPVCRHCLDALRARLGAPGGGAAAGSTFEPSKPYSPPYYVDPRDPRVSIETDHGELTIELFPRSAPRSVANFLAYVRAHRYDNVIVHRVEDFVVVMGRLTGGYGNEPLKEIAFFPPIPLESANGLENRRGSIGLPRRVEDPDSAVSDFHVNLLDNKHLDRTGSSPPAAQGFAVFGQVVSGWATIEAIRRIPTMGGLAPKGYETMPREPVRILHTVELAPIAALTSGGANGIGPSANPYGR